MIGPISQEPTSGWPRCQRVAMFAGEVGLQSPSYGLMTAIHAVRNDHVVGVALSSVSSTVPSSAAACYPAVKVMGRRLVGSIEPLSLPSRRTLAFASSWEVQAEGLRSRGRGQAWDLVLSAACRLGGFA